MTQQKAFRGIIGSGQIDITPPVGIYARNWGAASHDVAEGIHKPLKLSCLTFQAFQGDVPLVLISADLGWWKNAEHERKFRQSILDHLGLPETHLLFCLTHTHAGPGICEDDENKPGGHLIKPYLEQLVTASVGCVKDALKLAEPALLTWHYSLCDLAINREFPDPEKNRILTGFNPGAPADNTLLVGRITSLKTQSLLGTVVNYACHPTTLAWQNRLISPDFIGAMRELVEEYTEAPCLFLQGASGELSPPQQFTGNTNLADRYGRQLGFSVLSALESMEAPGHHLVYKGSVESGASLAIWGPEPTESSTTKKAEIIMVEYPIKNFPSHAELEREWTECEDRVLKERLWRKICIRKAIGDGQLASVPLWIWQLGNSLLIGQPNEAYSEYQIALRQKYADKAVAVMNLTNGSIGYLPPRDRYDLDTYPVWQTPFAMGSLDLLKKTTVEAIDSLILT